MASVRKLVTLYYKIFTTTTMDAFAFAQLSKLPHLRVLGKIGVTRSAMCNK